MVYPVGISLPERISLSGKSREILTPPQAENTERDRPARRFTNAPSAKGSTVYTRDNPSPPTYDRTGPEALQPA